MEYIISKPDKAKAKPARYKVPPRYHNVEYDVAGYDVVGNLDISKLHNDVYNTNHSPKYSYTMDIRDFNKLHNLPAELYNLDVLDGSAPCFSISNQKKLKETLEMPVEDYVHFELIKLAKKLQIRQRLGQPAGYYNGSIVYDNKPLPCLTNHAPEHLLFSEPRTLTQREIKLGTSFPLDFECPTGKTIPLINISTPPIMLHRISEQIYKQWLE